MCDRHPLQCVVPPYITEQLAKSSDPKIRDRAIAHLSTATMMRTFRIAAQAAPTLMASMAPNKQKNRLVYDARKKDTLPGKLVRSEGQVIRHNMGWTLIVLAYLIVIALVFYYVFPNSMTL